MRGAAPCGRGVRHPLRVSLSADDGHTWTHHLDLENTHGEGEGKGKGEFSYPAITAWPASESGEVDGITGGGGGGGPDSGGFTLTYTYNRVNIKFVSMGIVEFVRRAEQQRQQRREPEEVNGEPAVR